MNKESLSKPLSGSQLGNIPKVSVIVPVYNAEKFLRPCVESILAQTFTDFELILINDGSQDSSGVICQEYASQNRSIVYVEQTNQGPASARNTGMRIARGKYIGFVDSDDTILPEMYSTLFVYAEKSNAQIAICNYEMINCVGTRYANHFLLDGSILGRDRIISDVVATYFFNDDRGFYSLCNKIYNREFIAQSGITIVEKRVRAEDWLFNLELYQKAECIVATDKPLYRYIRQNGESVMASYRPNWFQQSLESREILLRIAEAHDIEYDKKAFNANFVSNAIEYIMLILHFEKENRRKKVVSILSNTHYQSAIRNSSCISYHLWVINEMVRLKLYGLAYRLLLSWHLMIKK